MKKYFRISLIILCVIFSTFLALMLGAQIITEINIHNGKIRNAVYIYSIVIFDDIIDTAISKNIDSGIKVSDADIWQPVCLNSLLHPSSPQLLFHRAEFQIEQIKIIFSHFGLSRNEKKEIAYKVLKLWQQYENDDAADAYIYSFKKDLIKRNLKVKEPTSRYIVHYGLSN